MTDGPGRAEFAAFSDRLYETVDEGFKAITSRLDTMNGRVLKGEIERENHRTRIIGLEKEVFHHPRRRSVDVPSSEFTKREKALIAFGLLVMSLMLEVLKMAGSKVWQAIAAVKP